jgi:hypothetical protein
VDWKIGKVNTVSLIGIETATVVRKANRHVQGFTEHEAGSGTHAPVPPSTAANLGTPSQVTAVPQGSGQADFPLRSVRSPIPAAKLYADRFGWPVAVQGAEVVVTCGEVLDITTMPSDLAVYVDRMLRAHGTPVPVIEVRGTAPEHRRTWAFVTASMREEHGDTLRTMARYKVDHFGGGAYLPLPPSPTNGCTLLRWLIPPSLNTEAGPLPPWEALAACTLRAIGHPVSQSPIRP